LSEFADQFEAAIKEKQDLACRLGKALDEIMTVKQHYQKARVEFDSERSRLNTEIGNLRAQIDEFSKRAENTAVDDGRIQSLLAARERLIRDEFERKMQELVVEVRRERTKHAQQVQKMKTQLSNCICRASGRD
jgi:signal transduction protein with GAF and PtsI domain